MNILWFLNISYFFSDFLVKDIIDSKIEGDQILYLVHWDGYSHEDDTWEPAQNISSALIAHYNSKQNKK